MSVKADLTFVTRLEISQATADGQVSKYTTITQVKHCDLSTEYLFGF